MNRPDHFLPSERKHTPTFSTADSSVLPYRNILPDKETEEKKRHSTAFLPYSYYECHIPRDFPNVPMHWHSEFEIDYVLEGQGEFICGDDRFTPQEGSLMLLPPNMLHAAYPCQNSYLVYKALVFSPVMLGANTGDRCTTECILPLINGAHKIRTLLLPDAPAYPPIKTCVEQIFSCVLENCPQMDLLLKSELLRLFWLLEKDESFLLCRDSKISCSELIRPALEHMLENYSETISIAQLAEITHLGRSYFMSCFKKAAGVSAIEYLTQLRINAACEAIASTDKGIAEIAYTCGYANLSNFNRQFKKIAGCSPKDYKKTVRLKSLRCL